MENFKEFTFPSSDGEHQIFCSMWLPEGEPRGVIQIVHGIGEYVNRYDEMARFFTSHGFVVCGDDHLGHGRTALQDGRFAVFAKHDGWTLVTADVRQLRRIMGERYPGIPYFLLGHSMGSFLARTYLCRYPGEVDGVLLSGTGQTAYFLVAVGRLLTSVLSLIKGYDYASPLIHTLSMGAYNRQFAPNRTDSDWTTRDEASVDKYQNDPLCHHMPTVGLYNDMMGGLHYICNRRALSQMDPNTPVYIYSGDKDPVGDNGKGVRKVYGYFEKNGTRDLTLHLYKDGRHEMHNELNKEEVFADLMEWLEQHI